MTTTDNAIAQAMTTAQVKYAKLLGTKKDAESAVTAAKEVMENAGKTFTDAERKAEAARVKAVDAAKAKLDQSLDEENQKIADWQVKVEDSEADLNSFLEEMHETLGVDLNFLVREPSHSGGRTRL